MVIVPLPEFVEKVESVLLNVILPLATIVEAEPLTLFVAPRFKSLVMMHLPATLVAALFVGMR